MIISMRAIHRTAGAILPALVVLSLAAAPRSARALEPERPGIWRQFMETEYRAVYSVNTIRGARMGGVPFVFVLGLAAALGSLGYALARRKSFAPRLKRASTVAFAAGALLFAARSAVDQFRIAAEDEHYLRGRSIGEKHAMLNPRGLYPLLAEGVRRIPPDGRVVLRAERPFPWEKGGYYLYPRRVAARGDWIISYRMSAPPDSAACELIFRREGIGSIYRRENR